VDGSDAVISLTRRQLLIVVASVAAIVGFGAAGYLIGHSTGEDLDAAREQGTAEGQREGSAQGAEEGFAEGRKEGREKAFAQSYDESYREAYGQAYEDAGLDPPEEITVPKPGE
jgi:hypothetical protein